MPRTAKTTPIRLSAIALATVLLVLLLVACGGSGKEAGKSSDQHVISVAGLPRAPEGIVARVGPISITQATYERAFAANVASEAPAFRVAAIPPYFTACIGHLRRAIEARKKSAPSKGDLKSKCAEQYKEARKRVLNELITNEWIVAAAEELGVTLSNLVVKRLLYEYKHTQFHSEASYRAFLRETHQTEGDLLFQKRVTLLGEGLRARLKRKVGVFTPSRVAAYYRTHSGLYTEPETRDLRILRTNTLREALQVRKEIAAGKSFAKVVADRHLQEQPIFSKNSVVHRLRPHGYSQPPLNNALFSATPGKLSGPVRITLGYYIFEVTKVHPAYLKPLSAVRAKIKSEVPAAMQQHALASFIAQWRKHWTAQTACSPGFVVRRCREYKVTATTPPDDAYTLN
jgi:foldase protein PrsA